MKLKALSCLQLAGTILFTQNANAASFDGTVQSVVSGLIKLFQYVALGYLAKNALDHIQNRPDAGEKSQSVILGIIVLISINAVWAWLQDKAK